MIQPAVFLVEEAYFCKGHLGEKKVVDFTIYLNQFRLRGFSTHGNMSEGYWSTSAEPTAKAYAEDVANALGVPVTRVKAKPK